MFLETLRRVGNGCRLSEWMGGSGAYGWMAGFEDLSVEWQIGTPDGCRPNQVPEAL